MGPVVDSHVLFELLVLMLSGQNQASHPQQGVSAPTRPRVVAMSSFKEGDGCISGFRRLGYTVTLKECVKMAKEAGITPIWDNTPREDINASPRINVPVKAGDLFAVIESKGKKQYVLYNSQEVKK